MISLAGTWLVAALLVGGSSSALAGGGYEVAGSQTFSSGIKVQVPIDVGMDVNGVRLGSVFFDTNKLQAFVILQNRTPIAVSAKIGISLFDNRGKLLATGIDVTQFSFNGDKISPGDQKNIELSFDRFINDYKNVSSFQLVLSLGNSKQPPADSNKATPNYTP